jgi:hypothetical protein
MRPIPIKPILLFNGRARCDGVALEARRLPGSARKPSGFVASVLLLAISNPPCVAAAGQRVAAFVHDVQRSPSRLGSFSLGDNDKSRKNRKIPTIFDK